MKPSQAKHRYSRGYCSDDTRSLACWRHWFSGSNRQGCPAWLLAWLLFWPGLGAADPERQIVHQVDFAGKTGVSTYHWLQSGGFLLQHDAKNQAKIHLSQSDGALHFKVLKPSFGLILHEEDAQDANHLRMLWGVSKFPAGASYEKGVDDEAIMIYVFFGEKRLPSGSMLVPDSPYFIGFFLCPRGTDVLEKPYSGRYYEKSGRFICLEHPALNTVVETEIDLREEFRKSFQIDEVPPVSGFSIEIDTTDGRSGGTAGAFIKRLEFLN